MKTIKTSIIDGYTIVTGVSVLATDPESTQAAAVQAINKLPESAAMQAKSDEKTRNIQEATQEKQAAQYYLPGENQWGVKNPNADPEKFRIHDTKYKAAIQNHLVCNDELVAMTPIVNAAITEVRRNAPVYCEPRAGEYIDAGHKIVGAGPGGEAIILSDADMAERGQLLPAGQTVDGLLAKHLACTDRQKLALSGEYIDDFMGCVFWYQDGGGQWVESEKISSLGVTKNTVVVDEYQEMAIEAGDLTAEQREEIRFQNLTAEQKTAEYESLKKSLIGQAVAMRSELEITGATDALEQSQAWFIAEEAVLKIKYGVV